MDSNRIGSNRFSWGSLRGRSPLILCGGGAGGAAAPPFRLLELAIASERARDSERASEAEGRLKRGVQGGFSPPGSPPADASAIWETGGPRGAQRAHLGGAHGVPKGPTGGQPHFPGKEIYPVKIDIFLESFLCPVTR